MPPPGEAADGVPHTVRLFHCGSTHQGVDRIKERESMRQSYGGPSNTRSSALWGGNGGGRRENALWGRGRHALVALIVLFAALPFAIAGAPAATGSTTTTAFMTTTLTSAVKAKPAALYNVIIKGKRGQSTTTV